MTVTRLAIAFVLTGAASGFAANETAQDWSQYRGANGNAKAEFAAPQSWPKELTQKWKVAVGEGVATPALSGDKVFVFSREEGNEVTRCLDAASGKELWREAEPTMGVNGPASSFAGPRSSPAVGDGKVVTLGVHGVLSCLEASTGKKLWRKTDVAGEPRFSVASSPLLVNGLCVAQLGGQGMGGIVAYDLSNGDEKWKWMGGAPGYASPALMTVGSAKLIVAETEGAIVALDAADGKLVWQTPFAAQGMGAYNAVTPVVDGPIAIYSGGGRETRAVKIEKGTDAFTGKELWSNPDQSAQFSSPVVKEGLVYGLSQSNELFCLDEQTGNTVWTASLGTTAPGGAAGPGNRPGGNGGPGRRPGGRMGGGGRGGYGSIVDAGSVLVALTPKSELVVFKPDAKAFTETARIKVADSATYAYPVLAGSRIFIKDQNALSLLTAE